MWGREGFSPQWCGEGKVLVPGLGSALGTSQSFFLFPTQGCAVELLTGKRMGQERTRAWAKVGRGPRSSILSSQPRLVPPAQSPSPTDTPGAGGLAASPSECWEGRGEALKCTLVNKPFFPVARQRRASPVELERVPVKRLRSVFQADKSLPLKCGRRAEAPSSCSCCQPLRINHSPVQIRVQSVAEHFSCLEEGVCGGPLGTQDGGWRARRGGDGGLGWESPAGRPAVGW